MYFLGIRQILYLCSCDKLFIMPKLEGKIKDLLRWIIVVGKMSYFSSTRRLFEGA
jgi:hypothetical protein